MTEPRIWDITQRVHSAIPLWPGEPPVTLSRHAAIDADCPVNVGAISMPLHTGTHADAPLHYSNGGLASADCALEPYVGRCVLIDVTGARERVEVSDCDWKALAGHTRVLMRSYRRFPHDVWDSNFKAIAPEVIERFGAAGVRLIGVDAPSLDPETSKTMDAHHQVLAADMRILEGLVLDDVPAGEYELIALPLKLVGADASPVRAILREVSQCKT
ncbi:arylformamidase [Qipengyuania sp. ASV99]|uniref:arylformamidase n=1 Tax=Qipengyuania sp. ASV99 TaxID=3399681 RepID=UPI003A4C648A